MITHDQRWSLARGNTLVPSRWQATPTVVAGVGPGLVVRNKAYARCGLGVAICSQNSE
jgi:hypothetical protein